MSADHVAVLVAALACASSAAVLVVVVVVLSRRVRQLARAVEELRGETVPLVRDARIVVDQAATEMVRVGDVLDSAEAVSATVDSASRLAYRALANPVVKLLAYGTGLSSALRRLVARGVPPDHGLSATPRTSSRRAPQGDGAPGRPGRNAPAAGGRVGSRARHDRLSARAARTTGARR